MPLFVLCFISFLRANEKCYRAFETGLMFNFWIITASVVVSVLTHTSSATYQSTNGAFGWYSLWYRRALVSAIMSILAPISVILLCYRRKELPAVHGHERVAALAQFHLTGTRLAFFLDRRGRAGVPIVLVLTGKLRTSKQDSRWCSSLIACQHLAKQSPMYIKPEPATMGP